MPTSSAFVPLIGALTTMLLGRRTIEAPMACGEPFALPLPADAELIAGLTVVREPDTLAGDQDGQDNDGAGTEIVEEPDGLVCRSTAVGSPGAVRIKRAERTVFALATAVPEQESDLTVLPASVFQNRLAGDRAVTYRDATRDAEARDSLWVWLALGCAVAVALELILLRALKT